MRVTNVYSIIYDLNQFGIFNINEYIVFSDMSDGIKIHVSFNGGKTFFEVKELNKKYTLDNNSFSKVRNSNGKIQVKIVFEKEINYNPYEIKITGSFQNLNIGTSIYFSNISNGKIVKTNIGENGKYCVNLTRGLYQIWYNEANKKVVMIEKYNPESDQKYNMDIDKESIIENILSDIDWTKFAIYDTFIDNSKIKIFNDAFINSKGELTDGITDKKIGYWAIGFN